MSETSRPTDGAREYAQGCADEMESALAHVEDQAKLILAEKVFQNGIRGNATAIREKSGEVLELVKKLRKAIHEDLGTPPTKAEEPEA